MPAKQGESPFTTDNKHQEDTYGFGTPSGKKIDLSRRKFVTLGAASAVAGSTLLATLPSQVMAEASKGMTGKQPTSVANNIDSAGYQRFHQKDTAFCQAL